MTNPIEIDPEGFERRSAQYVEWLAVRHYSEETLAERRKYLAYFFAWAADRAMTRPSEVTKPILERYQGYLFHYRKKNGSPLSLTSQWSRLQALRGFFRWLTRENYLLSNPASELSLPRVVRQLPRHVLSAAEAERVLSVPDVSASLGLRDRAILETLYSTGIRRRELVTLALYDLDWDRGTVVIRHGKGRRQRVIPIGARALGWVRKYLEEARPSFVVPPDEGIVFLASGGRPMSAVRLSEEVRAYVTKAGVGKRGAVHLFRHTLATLMLEGGADVRYVQAMLGHADISTTQIYTQVSVKKLKEIHEATHPAERKKREAEKEQNSEAAATTSKDKTEFAREEGPPPPSHRAP